MSTDVTPAHVAALFALMESAGLRPPEAFSRPPEPGQKVPMRVLAMRTYADAFTAYGAGPAEVHAAVLAYINEPDVGQYPKAWPDPGKILGRTTIGRAALDAGADPELDRAWAHFTRRMSALLPAGPDGPEDLHRDPLKARALWAGLEAMGGTEGYRMRGAEDPWPVKRWRAAVAAERQRQAREPETRRALVTTNEPKRLTVKA